MHLSRDRHTCRTCCATMSLKEHAVLIKKLQKTNRANNTYTYTKNPTKQHIQKLQVIIVSKCAGYHPSKERYPMLKENSKILEEKIEARPLALMSD